jgi:multiple sugar transport system ATP-binding protein
MARLAIREVSKRFQGHTAVDGVSLDVGDGELVVLLGPSGCGKSTLLRLIAGLEQATGGSILIGDRDVTRLRPKDRDVAMVFQNYALYAHLTIFENIAFPLRVAGLPNRIVQEKVRWAAELVEITRLLDRKPRQTSGGERQRTALARSLVRETAVLLLDEPLSNLDAKLRNTAREELRGFQQRVGVTAIHVTHDQTEAMGLGDRIVVMQAGRIHQIGDPETIYRHPADTFVAGFIGSPPMNLLPQADGHGIGFRPESLTQGEGDFTVDLRVQRVEFLGNERLVYGMAEPPLPPARIVARLPVGESVPEGGVARFGVAAAELRRFDAAGKAVAHG